jgi:hypothetical protein
MGYVNKPKAAVHPLSGLHTSTTTSSFIFNYTHNLNVKRIVLSIEKEFNNSSFQKYLVILIYVVHITPVRQ